MQVLFHIKLETAWLKKIDKKAAQLNVKLASEIQTYKWALNGDVSHNE